MVTCHLILLKYMPIWECQFIIFIPYRHLSAKTISLPTHDSTTTHDSLNSEADASHAHNQEDATTNLQTENLTLNDQQYTKDSTVVQPSLCQGYFPFH